MAFAWLLTNIFLPLLPLGLAWGLQYLRNQKFDLKKTVKDGQLCFYPIAIVGVAAFDYVPHAEAAILAGRWSNGNSASLLAMALVLGAAALAYAFFQFDYVSQRNEISDSKTLYVSLALTLCSIGISYSNHIC